MWLAGSDGLTFDRKSPIAPAAPERQKIGRADGFHFGARLQTIEQLLEERPALLKLRVLRGWQGDSHRQQVRRLKSRFDFLQAQKALNHQPRPDEHHQRERKLRDYQRASQTQPPQTLGAAASSF